MRASQDGFENGLGHIIAHLLMAACDTRQLPGCLKLRGV
jgi:hypothetical protein